MPLHVAKNLENSVQKDILCFYPKLKKIVINYLTEPTYGMKGPVSNTLLRKWGYYRIKKLKIELGYR
jgi:hypothetical protein